MGQIFPKLGFLKHAREPASQVESPHEFPIFELLSILKYSDSVIKFVTNNRGDCGIFFALLIQDVRVALSQLLPVFDRNTRSEGKGFLVILQLHLNLAELFDLSQLQVRVRSFF